MLAPTVLKTRGGTSRGTREKPNTENRGSMRLPLVCSNSSGPNFPLRAFGSTIGPQCAANTFPMAAHVKTVVVSFTRSPALPNDLGSDLRGPALGAAACWGSGCPDGAALAARRFEWAVATQPHQRRQLQSATRCNSYPTYGRSAGARPTGVAPCAKWPRPMSSSPMPRPGIALARPCLAGVHKQAPLFLMRSRTPFRAQRSSLAWVDGPGCGSWWLVGSDCKSCTQALFDDE